MSERIVEKDDILERDGEYYRVVCCDDEIFVLGHVTMYEDHFTTSYTDLEAYSNEAHINTLEALDFIKIN